MIIIILLSTLLNLSPAKASIDLGSSLMPVFTNAFMQNYPEEKNKEIKIYKGESPLHDPRPQREKSDLEKSMEDLETGIQEVVTDIGFNKFSIGTGAIDVTFQVRDGVRYALEDTFTGYAEFQRRKVLEEMLNANAKANQQTTEFLMISTGLKEESFGLMIFEDLKDIFENYFAFPEYSNYSAEPSWRNYRHHDLLQVSKNIIDKSIIKELNTISNAIAASILSLWLGFNIMMRLSNSHAGFSHVISEPLMQKIGSLIMIFASYHLLHLCFDACYFMNNSFHQFISDNGLDTSNIINLSALNQNWENFANQVGYFPAMVLSGINILAQIFVYIYIAGLLMQIILGFIISPLWAMASGIESLRASAISSFLRWLKALLLINFIPVIYMIFMLINNELNNLNLDILNISFAITALVLLPIVSNIILAENSSGALRSVFWGYEQALTNIESGYKQICKLLEDQYQLSQNLSK